MKDLVIVFQSFCPSQKDLSKSIISRFYFFFFELKILIKIFYGFTSKTVRTLILDF